MNPAYQEQLGLGVKDILDKELFADLVIKLQDGISVKSHKLILASASQFLKKTLMSNNFDCDTEKEAILILPDFTVEDIQTVIPYLYGSANERYKHPPDQSIVETLRLGEFQTKFSADLKPNLPIKDNVNLESVTAAEIMEEDWIFGEDDVKSEVCDNVDDVPGQSQTASVSRRKTLCSKMKRKYVKTGRKWKCTKCNQVKDKMSQFRDHNCVTENNLIVCFGCKMRMDNFDSLKSHLKSHPKCELANFLCPFCPRAFDSRASLIRHKVVHKKSAKKCGDCSKSFRTQRMLINHRKKSHGVSASKKEHPCPKCPDSFNFAVQLDSHLSSAHPTSGSAKITRTKLEYYCDHCDAICPTRSSLSYHLQKHETPSHPCPQCSKSFKSEFGLEYHLKIHNGEANFLCDDCGRKFITPYKLLQHRRSKHTNERPFICEECGEGFVRNDKLTVHKRRAHTGERPYSCNICDWRGVDSSSLIHHKKKHVKTGSVNVTSGSAMPQTTIEVIDSKELLITELPKSDSITFSF